MDVDIETSLDAQKVADLTVFLFKFIMGIMPY